MIDLVCGASGFVGSALCEALERGGRCVVRVGREVPSFQRDPIGTVYYCAGVTGDFLQQMPNTVDANCGFLARLIEAVPFRSLVYLSSTRVISSEAGLDLADRRVVVDTSEPDHLYNASKALGEIIAVAGAQRIGATCHVVRLAHVLGFEPESPNFFWMLLRAALSGERIVINSSPESTRDYVDVEDVAEFLALLPASEPSGCHYAVSGNPVTLASMIGALQACPGLTVNVGFREGAPTTAPPVFSNETFVRVLGRRPDSPLSRMTRIAERAIKAAKGNRPT